MKILCTCQNAHLLKVVQRKNHIVHTFWPTADKYSLPQFPSPFLLPAFTASTSVLMCDRCSTRFDKAIGKHSSAEKARVPNLKWICSQMWTSNHLRILFLLHLMMWTVPFGLNGYTSTFLPSNCKVKNHSLTMQCLSSRWKGRGYTQFLLQFLLQFPAHTVTLPF